MTELDKEQFIVRVEQDLDMLIKSDLSFDELNKLWLLLSDNLEKLNKKGDKFV